MIVPQFSLIMRPGKKLVLSSDLNPKRVAEASIFLKEQSTFKYPEAWMLSTLKSINSDICVKDENKEKEFSVALSRYLIFVTLT